MSKENQTVVRVGPSGLMLLTIALLFLEAFDKIDIGWLWVFSPLWIPFALVAAFFVIAFLVWLVCAILLLFIK
jgi:hypothetical protein